MKIMWIILVLSLALACNCGPGQTKNIFSDLEMQKIYDLQDNRDSAGIITYLESSKPAYQRAAALGLASVQDPASLTPLFSLLTNGDEQGRAAAAYAIGQLGNPEGESLLLEVYGKESSPMVKRDILEALGKCGGQKGVAFLAGLSLQAGETLPLTGQARGLLRMGLGNKATDQATAKVVELLEKIPERDISIPASYYLARLKGQDLGAYLPRFIDIYKGTNCVFTRANLALALGKVVSPESREFLQGIMTANVDYRIRVNALRAAVNFPYAHMKEKVMACLEDKNTHVAAQAASFFLASGTLDQGEAFYQAAQTSIFWQPRATMLAAALKWSAPGEGRQQVAEFIKEIFGKSSNSYEQGLLLMALSEAPEYWRFVAEKTFASSNPVLKSYGIQALTTMRRHKEYNPAWDEDFAGLFKDAVQSGDVAMVALGADILCDPAMNYIEYFKGNTAFLTETLDSLKLPENVEVYQALLKAVRYFNPHQEFAEPKVDTLRHPMDWRLVTSLAPGCRGVIKTGKGDITLELFVNQAPGSVANFVELVRKGAYKNNHFHRVIPNFVAQAGCPRGDGWGSSSSIIRSELGPLYYDEGSVGMASSGKDTESSQWFITHNPTAHLDGGYSIFARVIEGMDVVHKLELGDLILDIQL